MRQRVESRFIIRAETAMLRAVDIQHTQQFSVFEKRRDNFRARCGIANNVTVELVDVVDAYGFP